MSGSIYVPFELIEIVHRPTGLSVALLLVNLTIVALMVYALIARRRAARSVA